MKPWELLGCIVAMVTPFLPNDSETLDEEGLRKLINYLIADQQVSGIVPCGTTGEAPTLTHEEHLDVIRITVEEVNGRVPVIAGAGSNSTREAIELTKAAASAGADATLQVGPYYNKPNQVGIIKHFEKIANATDLPIILYNIPGRTGKNIEPETIVKLSKEFPTIVALKDASGDLNQTMKVIEGTLASRFHVYSGDDSLTLPILSIGGHGVISVAGLIMGKEIQNMIDLALNFQYGTAMEIHYDLLKLMNALFVEPNPAPIKQALNWMGLPAGPVRLPLVDISPMSQELLRNELVRLNKIEEFVQPS
ncbi:TPA: 4-hydroxy-tetrahydrodipicolinate synthase [candidate division CPR2 bacterium]|uniref:4-hydroxy-tetrahydrodipicolinate synthase n=1 Tax=candidate division CPR2 bacterium GW2011_GWC1_41_48 TaxID=1618344 RepID=A0A0G0Z7R6_UNCC2|nr:MAG: Dihydrodipicolinate synthase [candidate division CPR2 bacterium GW2011_GWC2_39_35]KKR28351.1 MAG: Dihydrodipicolinate synthase [candidate division CPR2 bacterium GW2011_GWD2_39_7]KKR28384.1 MAG: Dihydrodipicolinate synthase [candidate division CPR2 bacterium GW2011_GWD1_39_7]KKS09068.1 MAG: Dihydrodipicolinate synthase [candidate division CPR2 bacterium GW2011_GWC1_41_48]OGB60592.1 MAG: 4-hydroxy-tetrahydrodipicolinate synthase [candidate division CPR2 bacterium GWD1_39_7]OGB72545.1 MA